MNMLYSIGISAVIGFTAGWNVCTWKNSHEAAKQQTQAIENKEETDALQNEIDVENTTVVLAETERSQDLIREVIRYKPVVTMPALWVLRHDCATVPASEQAACEADGATQALEADPVTDQEALLTVTENYNHCRGQMALFEGLQAWVDALPYPER